MVRSVGRTWLNRDERGERIAQRDKTCPNTRGPTIAVRKRVKQNPFAMYPGGQQNDRLNGFTRHRAPSRLKHRVQLSDPCLNLCDQSRDPDRKIR